MSRVSERIHVTFWAFLVTVAAFMTMKYFPGLENEVAYAGNAFQTIFPDAFPGDPYRAPDAPIWSRPLQLSLIYVIVKIVGEPWLNDFFLAGFYLLLVVAGLAGIDRTARLLGITRPVERAFVLLFFAKDHQILTGKVLVAHHQDVNHSALAIPIVIWLIYFALARRHLALLLLVSLVLVAVSPRAACFPVLFAMGIKFYIGSKIDRITIGALSAIGLLILYFVLFHIFPISSSNNLVLWDLILAQEGDDANAFVQDSLGPMPVRHALWLAIMGGAFYYAGKIDHADKPLRALIVLGLVTYVLGGAYLNFAPDVLKQPMLISLVPARALSVVQNFAYLAILAGCLGKIRNAATLGNLGITALILAVLYLAGPGNYMQWAALVALGGALGLLFVMIRFRLRQIAPAGLFKEAIIHSWRLLLVLPVILSLVVGYGHSLKNNWSAWQSAWDHGVYGHAEAAIWIGVDDYFRNHTPKDATVMPFQCRRGAQNCDVLRSSRGLATRSGRAMPTPEVYGADFLDPKSWHERARREQEIVAIANQLMQGNVTIVAEQLQHLVPVPQYLVIPKFLNLADAFETRTDYKLVKTFPSYHIFKQE